MSATTNYLSLDGSVRSSASFSEDRAYRYWLWRQWEPALPMFVVIGLNPSTADETQDDPTIRRCVGFAKREKCGALAMINLFAIRATDPKAMLKHDDPVGPENDDVILAYAHSGGIVVAAWGAHGAHRGRDKTVTALVPGLRCFGVTKSGQPKHPLYLAANTPLVLVSAAERPEGAAQAYVPDPGSSRGACNVCGERHAAERPAAEETR